MEVTVAGNIGNLLPTKVIAQSKGIVPIPLPRPLHTGTIRILLVKPGCRFRHQLSAGSRKANEIIAQVEYQVRLLAELVVQVDISRVCPVFPLEGQKSCVGRSTALKIGAERTS